MAHDQASTHSLAPSQNLKLRQSGCEQSQKLLPQLENEIPLCRYKHRELLLGEAQVKGKWSSDEEARLTELVTQYIEERPVGHIC